MGQSEEPYGWPEEEEEQVFIAEKQRDGLDDGHIPTPQIYSKEHMSNYGCNLRIFHLM